jgi:coenzyme F420-reducing hydrogenase delta subunit
LRLKWVSASEGAAFAEEIRMFVQLLTELGEVGIENQSKIINL